MKTGILAFLNNAPTKKTVETVETGLVCIENDGGMEYSFNGKTISYEAAKIVFIQTSMEKLFSNRGTLVMWK